MFDLIFFSGILSLLNIHNFRDSQYILNVSVSDGVYTSFSRVRVEILPENLHNPVFNQPQTECKVFENEPPGTFVTQVTASDDDFGVYGDLSYYFSAESLIEYFEINETTGVITTTKVLDREQKRIFSGPIVAVDQGGRVGFTNIRIKIEDKNDNHPVFYLSEYKSTIPGNWSVESEFCKVKATDADDGINSQIIFSIADASPLNAKELFGIDSITGSLYILKSAMPFINQVFQFYVKAEDKGTPVKHSTVPVEVYIADVADIIPIFKRKDETFFLSEKSPSGTVITKLRLATNVTTTFKIVSDSADNPQFHIDQDGQLSLAQKLDREEKEFHLISVLAENKLNHLITGITDITLKVLDENDNAPKFEKNPYTCIIAENVEEGSSLLRVLAQDDDQGRNREIRYSIEQDIGELGNVFGIDSYSGWIRTLVPLDKETISEYNFQVVATDNGIQKNIAKTTVQVKLKDYNDNPPVFTSDHYSGFVGEDALPGTVVIQLKTTDRDSDLETSVDLYVTSGDPMSQFQIRKSGEIFVAKALDREKIPEYSLQVAATDGKFVTFTTVTVTVIDANG